MSIRCACDTGGTFTDLVVEDHKGRIHLYKASTTPADPVQGILDAVALAAADFSQSLADFLGDVSSFVHGTTHSINAIITGATARTGAARRWSPGAVQFRRAVSPALCAACADV